jgi:carbonic anhydrase
MGVMGFQAAQASEQGKGHASPAVKVSSASSHTSDGSSRVFSGEQPTHAPAAHEQKTASTGHGETVDTSHGAAPKQNAGHGGHWAYTGDAGPGNWGSLKAEYAACSTGKMQSPINISGGMPVDSSKIEFNYKISDLTIRNNGHTVQADYDNGSHIVVDGHRFDLLQFHFHTPSEHLIDGKKYQVEMHLVHKDAGGTLAVVGVMMELGQSNLALGEVIPHLPESAGDPAQISGIAINARDLLPEHGSYNHYKGSLTTPPCSEGVNWFVLSKPVQASAAQIARFTAIMGDNARPAQSTHNRLVISNR